ncbi:ADP-ribose pyrophosphatase [Actinopolymorpha cephalotaxi]|uniref:ADP-ribose pyrophosphatase n=1 Tax=Actinopolymorpha cephalotaxi TaxID=504797 RepID=A0A1I2VSR8_9ACTN|nr:NUDIX hydrolase [Actinopolymorpha cephalotaxi]NYH83214.1 ADP-ribose pyrophosphatase [Actinopolymorpha cephalotaxi]SFG91387.1 ADP-ribose pyrophosphatase [Actinopolymorpha cephalotaxi]
MSGATVDGRFGNQNADGAPPRDVPERWPVASSSYTLSTGRVIAVRKDVVDGGDGREFTRDVVVHSGAVGIIAMDDRDRMLLVHQYRHPVGHRLFEPPAGLLDVEGEDYLAAAQRELYEEGHVRARDWRVLVDAFTSPGMTTESLRIYLARGLSEVPHDERHNGVDEEADMTVSWTPLADVVAGVLAGDLHNPSLVMGALAAWAARNGAGFDALRPADAPWPAREAVPYEPLRPT